MKKQLDIKKLLILNLPYLLMGLFATNFGEAWRMAQGADASAKMLSFFSTLPVALGKLVPSCTRWIYWWACAVALVCRLAVYLKSKNAKKYRHGMEYGSARWGTHEDIAGYIIAREKSDDTLKSIITIPVSYPALIGGKLIVCGFLVRIFGYGKYIFYCRCGITCWLSGIFGNSRNTGFDTDYL